MQSSTNTSPLLDRAVRIRSKNTELRQKLNDLQVEVDTLEKNLCKLRNNRDHLIAQCEKLRETQRNVDPNSIFDECQQQFRKYIEDIDHYISNKHWTVPDMTEFLPSDSRSSLLSASDINQTNTPNDELNQQLASVENWLMESAVTDMGKTSSIEIDPRPSTVDDGTDDLYKDLIFPALDEDMASQTEDVPVNENNRQDEKQPRMDKHQRRFALMRQLAEKSNKIVTRKLM